MCRMTAGLGGAWVVLALLIGCFCVVQPAAADEVNIKLGAIFSKSGAAARNNFQLLQAVRFAVDEINNSGGLLGKKIKLLEYDNESNPIKSKLAARQAVKDDVLAVIGASWSDHSLAMAPVLQKANITMITPTSTNPKITKAGEFIFRACFDDTFQGDALARFAVDEFHAKSAALIVNLSSSYSMYLAESFTKRFTQLGGVVLYEGNYKDDAKNFSSILEKIRTLHPDVVFMPGYDECGYIVKQAQDLGVDAVFLGGDGWGVNQFYAYGGQELKKGYYASHWSPSLDNAETQRFVRRYASEYALDETAALGYDSVMLLADAVKRAGSLDKKAVRDALAATKNFHGVSGTFNVGQNGDPVKGLNIMEITEGKPKYYTTVQP